MTWKYIKASKYIPFGQNIDTYIAKSSYAAEVVKHIESGQNPNQVQRDLKLIRPLRQFSSGILSLSLYMHTHI